MSIKNLSFSVALLSVLIILASCVSVPLAIAADCNRVAGSYQGESGDLAIDIAPVTLADCGPGSRSAQFIDLLAAGALYFVEGDNLYIDLMAAGGTMVFAPAEEAERAEAG